MNDNKNYLQEANGFSTTYVLVYLDKTSRDIMYHRTSPRDSSTKPQKLKLSNSHMMSPPSLGEDAVHNKSVFQRKSYGAVKIQANFQFIAVKESNRHRF